MLFIILRRLNVDKHWKQGFRKASVLSCTISRTVVPETHFIKPIKRALVVSCCPSNGPWGTVYVKCMNICELIFFSLFFSWHWLAHVGLCLWHCVWRGNPEHSPGPGPTWMVGPQVRGAVPSGAWSRAAGSVLAPSGIWGNEWKMS